MVDCRETKARYRADHVMVVPLVWKNRKGEDNKILLSGLEGDELADTINRRAKKIIQKQGGGEIVRTGIDDASFGIPLTMFWDNRDLSLYECRNNIIGPDAENPGTLTEPRAARLRHHCHHAFATSSSPCACLSTAAATELHLRSRAARGGGNGSRLQSVERRPAPG